MSIKLFVRHKLEEISTFTVMATNLYGEFLSIIVYICWLYFGNFYLRILWLAYTVFWIYDRKSERYNGRGQGSKFLRDLPIYRYFASYFPIKIVKTVDLPADKNYLFATFPHGILSFGLIINFGTNATNFAKEFPGIRAKACTLNMHFQCPIFRELVLGWGMMSANAVSIMNHLLQSNDKSHPSNSDGYTSNAVAIVVGGAKEAYNSRPGDYILVLNERKGFVKLALKAGSPIVPVFSFGEIDVYDQKFNPPGSLMRWIQDTVKRMTGIAPILFIGQGFLQNKFGIIPYRKSITTVVGAPIHVDQCDNPTDEMVQKLHDEFEEELRNLFDTHKWKYVENAQNVKLIIE